MDSFCRLIVQVGLGSRRILKKHLGSIAGSRPLVSVSSFEQMGTWNFNPDLHVQLVLHDLGLTTLYSGMLSSFLT